MSTSMMHRVLRHELAHLMAWNMRKQQKNASKTSKTTDQNGARPVNFWKYQTSRLWNTRRLQRFSPKHWKSAIAILVKIAAIRRYVCAKWPDIAHSASHARKSRASQSRQGVCGFPCYSRESQSKSGDFWSFSVNSISWVATIFSESFSRSFCNSSCWCR